MFQLRSEKIIFLCEQQIKINRFLKGHKDCLDFIHVTYISDYLSQNLPNFKYETTVIEERKWKKWVARVNMDENWNQSSSPIIWKQIDYIGGKKYLIGGLIQFLKYAQDYYYISSTLNIKQLRDLRKDAAQFDSEEDVLYI